MGRARVSPRWNARRGVTHAPRHRRWDIGTVDRAALHEVGRHPLLEVHAGMPREQAAAGAQGAHLGHAPGVQHRGAEVCVGLLDHHARHRSPPDSTRFNFNPR